KPIASEWCDASYWIDHLRHPVRFREAMSEALAPGPALVFDVGPGRTMSALAEANESWDDHHQTCQTLSREDALAENAATTLAAYAAPWLQGAEAAWADVRPRREHRRVALPTYAWQHSQYCFDVPKSAAVIEHAQNNLYALTLEPWNGETNVLPQGAIALAHSAGDGALETLREVFSDRRVVSLQTGPDTQRTHALTWTVSDGDEQILQRLRARHGLLAAYIDLREPSPEVALLRAHSIATSALASDESLRLLFVRRTPDSESAGVFAGVVPVLRTELPHVSARVVDVSAAGTSGLRVLRTELERDDLSWSLWRDGVRHRRVAAPAASSTLSERQFATSWDEESVLLVSGGFGGIAQALIEGLSTEHPGLRVALLSRTGLPSPPDDSVADDPYAQRRTAVAGLRNLGCRVVVHAVDVCDADAVARVTRAVEHELGPIGAVLHTAGRLDDALIGTRPADELQAVLAPKVQGARNLVNAISHRPNAWFIAFSSTSAFSGLPGQLSYAAANAWLDDYARRLAGAGRMAMSLAWPAWRETGMAANRLATLRGEYGPPSVAGPGVRVVERTHDTLTLRITLRESDWVLADHRLRGGGTVLPGAALIAYAYGAALEQQPNTPCSLRDTVFEQPVFVHGTRGVFLRIAGDRWRIEGDDRTVYCQGRYDDVPDGDTRQLSMPELSLRASDAADHQHMLFGERWQCIEGFAHDGQDRWTSLRLPAAFEADLKQWPIHPALLDFAIASGVSLSEQEPFFVPFAIERVDIYGAIPEQSYSRTTLTREQHETLTFASDVAAADGRVIVRVSGFVQRAVSNVSALVQRSNVAGTIDAASALQSALLKGIDNKTGIRAFLDSLEVPGANHLVVGTSPPAIGAAVVQRAAPTLTSTAQTGVAPSSSTESLVAEIWTQLLGAPVTDVDADFFALGGHSLNAIRLISRLNDKLGTSLAMSALFECPTVRSLSTLLDARSEGSPPLERAPETSAESAITLNSPSSLLPTMSAAQRGIWFQERSAPQGSAFHVCGAYRLSRTPDLSALAAAVRAVGDRHIALRCRFPAVNGLPEAVVSPEGSISLAHDQYATDEGWADRVAATTFDVEQGPLCRIVLGSHESGTEGSSTDAEPEATLLVVVHHIVCDEWSLEVIIDELSALYEAALGGVTGNALLKLLPPAPALFAAYAGGVTAPTAADGRRQALAGAPMVLPLPHDHAPRDSGVRAGKRLVRMAPAPVGRALREFSSDAGVSLFVSMLALYVAFVARWSGQNDVLVGTPASTRDTQELESAVGLFIDTVVVRGELDDSPSLTTLARRTRDDVLRAFDEERVPFGELVRALGGARTPGVHPLYQTMLAVYPVERSLSLGTIAAQPLHVDAGGVQVDLTLYVADHGDALEWIAEYDTGVFASETIERALKRFEHLILAAAAAPGTSLLALDALPSAERDALISWGTGPSALRRDDDLVLHRMQQRDASQKTAVFAGSHSLTYRELASLRRRAASQLVDAGVKPGQTVAVALTRRAELPAILLAIWEVGATYLPIDVHFPEDRIEWMLRDSGATHIYTEDALQDALISDLPRVSLELIPRRAKQIPATPQNAEAAAYVIYTSGSTGKPKGVRVPHGAVANFVASMCREPGITASDNLLAVTTISFDISVLEVFAPLVAGATLTIASESESKDAFALIRLLDDQRVSVMQATPSTWRMLVAAEWAGAGVKALCGGEPLPRDLAQALVPRVSALWNMYGPTETTVWSTCAKIDDPSERIRIGLPIDNTRVAVASVNGRLQPV
ncbi:MAG: non-ribosomal peptide synthetase component F, partial [Bradymonadia bacterium]